MSTVERLDAYVSLGTKAGLGVWGNRTTWQNLFGYVPHFVEQLNTHRSVLEFLGGTLRDKKNGKLINPPQAFFSHQLEQMRTSQVELSQTVQNLTLALGNERHQRAMQQMELRQLREQLGRLGASPETGAVICCDPEAQPAQAGPSGGIQTSSGMQAGQADQTVLVGPVGSGANIAVNQQAAGNIGNPVADGLQVLSAQARSGSLGSPTTSQQLHKNLAELAAVNPAAAVSYLNQAAASQAAAAAAATSQQQQLSALGAQLSVQLGGQGVAGRLQAALSAATGGGGGGGGRASVPSTTAEMALAELISNAAAAGSQQQQQLPANLEQQLTLLQGLQQSGAGTGGAPPSPPTSLAELLSQHQQQQQPPASLTELLSQHQQQQSVSALTELLSQQQQQQPGNNAVSNAALGQLLAQSGAWGGQQGGSAGQDFGRGNKRPREDGSQ